MYLQFKTYFFALQTNYYLRRQKLIIRVFFGIKFLGDLLYILMSCIWVITNYENLPQLLPRVLIQ